MSTIHDGTVQVQHESPRLPDGVLDADAVAPQEFPGFQVFSYFNGPTDQLSGVSTGRVVLEPGAKPHDPHRHPEEEFMIVAEGSGEIVCGASSYPAGPGAIMYCGGNVLHGITNTGRTPLTFYWMKWTARGF